MLEWNACLKFDLDSARSVCPAEFLPLPLDFAKFFDNVCIPQSAHEETDESRIREADREQNTHW